MKKRIAVFILDFSVSIETAGTVQAQTMDTGLAFEPEESYVIMGEDRKSPCQRRLEYCGSTWRSLYRG